MYSLRPANQRGRTQIDWLDSYHTFSFGQYYDPRYMGFGDLRVINDDVVAPGAGFGMHPHDNMEIISVVLSGALEHKDNLGHGEILYPGEIQIMTAGSGIIHSEFNPSSTEPVHFLQIWIMTNQSNLPPYYEQKPFPLEEMRNRLKLIVSGTGKEQSLKINQDVRLYQSILNSQEVLTYQLSSKRRYWVQVAYGSLEVNGHLLVAGDGLAIVDEQTELDIRAVDNNSNFLLFDLKN